MTHRPVPSLSVILERDPPLGQTAGLVRTLLHTLFFWTYFVFVMPLFFAVALPLWLVTLPFDRNGRILHSFTCFWGGHYVFVNPMWRIHIDGREHVDRKKAYVFCSNHQSAGDIPVLFGLFLPFKFVSKHSNFRAPFLGWNMTLNRYVSLVRGDRKSVASMMRACAGWLGRNVSVLMFPEGTRSRTGHLLPFKAGAFTLAKDANVPVIPIVIDGTIEAVPRNAILSQKGIVHVYVRVCPPVDSMSYPDASSLRDAVRDVMQKTQAELWRARGLAPVERPNAAAPRGLELELEDSSTDVAATL
jgi:1-acyl-sn-glycerol-3-phosphate acyltransferase